MDVRWWENSGAVSPLVGATARGGSSDLLILRRRGEAWSTVKSWQEAIHLVPGPQRTDSAQTRSRTADAHSLSTSQSAAQVEAQSASNATRRALPLMASSSDALLHLSSIFPDHSNGTLARYLAASNGSLERATTAIISNTPLVTSASSKRRKVAGGLSHWITRPAVVEAPFVPTAPGKRSALESLRPPADVIATPQALPPLVLSTPELVVKHTNGLCTLILDVLPKDLATELFLKMIEESEGVREGGRVCESRIPPVWN